MSPDCILFPRVIVKTSGLFKSPGTLASETQHCTGGHSLPWMSGIHLLPESEGFPALVEQKRVRGWRNIFD